MTHAHIRGIFSREKFLVALEIGVPKRRKREGVKDKDHVNETKNVTLAIGSPLSTQHPSIIQSFLHRK